jgi:hypothetical protein
MGSTANSPKCSAEERHGRCDSAGEIRAKVDGRLHWLCRKHHQAMQTYFERTARDLQAMTNEQGQMGGFVDPPPFQCADEPEFEYVLERNGAVVAIYQGDGLVGEVPASDESLAEEDLTAGQIRELRAKGKVRV